MLQVENGLNFKEIFNSDSLFIKTDSKSYSRRDFWYNICLWHNFIKKEFSEEEVIALIDYDPVSELSALFACSILKKKWVVINPRFSLADKKESFRSASYKRNNSFKK